MINIIPTEVIDLLNLVFDPLLAMDPNPTNPALTILIIAFLVSLITNIANRYLGNPGRVKEIQSEVKTFNDELMEARKDNDSDKLTELNEKQPHITKLQSEMMLNMFKPLIITYLPVILMISWMQSSLQSTVIILPQVVYWVTLTPFWHVIGSMLYGGEATVAFGIGWLLWYMICSFGINQILKNYIATN